MVIGRAMLTILVCVCMGKNDEFDRDPTPTEIEFGKQNGVLALIKCNQGHGKRDCGSLKMTEQPLLESKDVETADSVKKVVIRTTREEKGKRQIIEKEAYKSEDSACTSSSDDTNVARSDSDSDSSSENCCKGGSGSEEDDNEDEEEDQLHSVSPASEEEDDEVAEDRASTRVESDED
jgi:hypothetical protein